MDSDPGRAAALRASFEDQKRRVLEAGDEDAIAQINELERRAADQAVWDSAPSVLDQLADHLRRLGIY